MFVICRSAVHQKLCFSSNFDACTKVAENVAFSEAVDVLAVDFKFKLVVIIQCT